jgi:hypothetical protein
MPGPNAPKPCQIYLVVVLASLCRLWLGNPSSQTAELQRWKEDDYGAWNKKDGRKMGELAESRGTVFFGSTRNARGWQTLRRTCLPFLFLPVTMRLLLVTGVAYLLLVQAQHQGDYGEDYQDYADYRDNYGQQESNLYSDYAKNQAQKAAGG